MNRRKEQTKRMPGLATPSARSGTTRKPEGSPGPGLLAISAPALALLAALMRRRIGRCYSPLRPCTKVSCSAAVNAAAPRAPRAAFSAATSAAKLEAAARAQRR